MEARVWGPYKCAGKGLGLPCDSSPLSCGTSLAACASEQVARASLWGLSEWLELWVAFICSFVCVCVLSCVRGITSKYMCMSPSKGNAEIRMYYLHIFVIRLFVLHSY